MIVIMMLTSIGRCASPALCPTDAELITAVRGRDNAVVQTVSDQAYQDDPSSVYLVHSERIRRISDVTCGDKLPNEQDTKLTTINCKFTVRYWSRNAYQVARLIFRDGSWEIADALVVTRDRR